MKAVGKYVIVNEDNSKSSTTKGGLIVLNKDKENTRYRKGSVVNVGTDVLAVNVKDNIYFDNNAGFKIEINEDLYTVIKEQDIVIII